MSGPPDGLRVIDAASIFAGPLVASLLGDFGADVIKIEHPSGDHAYLLRSGIFENVVLYQ